MMLCDRCVREEAKHVLKLKGESDCVHFHWILCGDCLNHVCEEARKSVENHRSHELREFCPSLTPEQAKQVERYVASRIKK